MRPPPHRVGRPDGLGQYRCHGHAGREGAPEGPRGWLEHPGARTPGGESRRPPPRGRNDLMVTVAPPSGRRCCGRRTCAIGLNHHTPDAHAGPRRRPRPGSGPALDVQLRLHPDLLGIAVVQGASAILVGAPLPGQAGSDGPPASAVRWIGWRRWHGMQGVRCFMPPQLHHSHRSRCGRCVPAASTGVTGLAAKLEVSKPTHQRVCAPSQGGSAGSNPVGVTNQHQYTRPLTCRNEGRRARCRV
jgi:hypothetical protein